REVCLGLGHLMARRLRGLAQRKRVFARDGRVPDQRLDVERADPRDEARAELAQLDEVLLQLAVARLRELVARVRRDERADVRGDGAELFPERVLLGDERVEGGDEAGLD